MVRMLDRWDLYNNTKDMAATTPCHYLGRNLSIYFDGSVNPCDIDYEGKLSVGSVKDSIKSQKYGDLIRLEFYREHRMPQHIKDVGVI